MLTFYNSLTKKKEKFVPRTGKKVCMFVCGITPYSSAHIGNIKTALQYDMIARYLIHCGYHVVYVQNVTDIDDKIVEAAQKQKRNWKEIGDYYFNEFLTICHALHITTVTHYAKATDHIPEIIAQIMQLIKKGYAYECNGNVYFEVKKDKEYGKLSGQNLAKLHRSLRLEKDPDKKHQYDFVIWKARGDRDETYEPTWHAPWGTGRPGWHIEDTAISEKYFGPQYDIHGGAIELIFPHHEAEIALQESASGKKPLVKYWIHTGILLCGKQKMSKSLHNFITAKEMVTQYDPDTFRFMIISIHYRSPISYTQRLLSQAGATLKHIRETALRLQYITIKRGKKCDLSVYKKEFYACMDDDCNTPAALAVLFRLIHAVNKQIVTHTLSMASARMILIFIEEMAYIFGVAFLVKDSILPEHIRLLGEKREKARQAHDWVYADTLRQEMEGKGYIITDTKEGYRVIKNAKS